MSSNAYEARVLAEQDAKANVNIVLWLLLGFFLHFLGLIIAFVYKPSPPVSNIFGKTQTEALFYETTFKTKARNLQLTYSFIGFVSIHFMPLIMYRM